MAAAMRQMIALGRVGAPEEAARFEVFHRIRLALRNHGFSFSLRIRA